MLGDIVSGLQDLSHKSEMRESRDEILSGEIITIMVEHGYPPIGFWTNSDYQRMRFKAKDSVLYSVTITVDRKTGGSALMSAVVGDKATLNFLCEIKNFLADPDDLVKMYRTDIKNIFKIPILGNVKIDHQLNSIIAYTSTLVEIKDYILKGEEGREKLSSLIFEKINLLKEKLAPYKKK